MEIKIFPSNSLLAGPADELAKVDAFFTFVNKAAEGQVRRFKKSMSFKDRQIASSNDGILPPEWIAWKEARLDEMKAAVTVHACIYNEDGSLSVPTGLVPRLLDFLESRGISAKAQDERNFDLARRSLSGSPPPRLRRPQQEALDILLSEERGRNKGLGLVRIATGVGKTVVAEQLIKRLGHRSIFLVPSLPILKQTAKRYEAAFGKKNVKVYGGGKKDIGYITIATYQSVYKGSPDDFKDIDMVVADEVHHVSAETFFDVVMNKLRRATHRYGLTAFEERADNSTLLIEAAVGPVVYQYDAPQAIADGYLAKPTFMIFDVLATSGKWTSYKIKNKKRVPVSVQPCKQYDGDNDMIASRHWTVGNDILNDFVALATNSFVEDGKSVLILIDEKEHGERLKQRLPAAGLVFGGGKENERMLREFNARHLKVIVGTSTIGEGADTIPVDVLINLQGGASRSRTLQAVGRALRNETDENGVAQKPTCLVIDFNYPQCRILERHSKFRESVLKTMGEVHRGTIA
jgi:superfamily II DNA or RNA helicase